MAKKESEIVYICSCKRNTKDYWVLPMHNGMNVARVTTHLLEEVFRDTEWDVFSVGSLESLDGEVKWLFATKEDYYAYFEGEKEDV